MEELGWRNRNGAILKAFVWTNLNTKTAPLLHKRLVTGSTPLRGVCARVPPHHSRRRSKNAPEKCVPLLQQLLLHILFTFPAL